MATDSGLYAEDGRLEETVVKRSKRRAESAADKGKAKIAAGASGGRGPSEIAADFARHLDAQRRAKIGTMTFSSKTPVLRAEHRLCRLLRRSASQRQSGSRHPNVVGALQRPFHRMWS